MGKIFFVGLAAILSAHFAVTAFTQEKSPSTEQVAHQVVQFANIEREKKGLPPLKVHPLLMAAAQAFAEDMAENNYFGHTDRQGKGPSDRVKALGYPSGAAENCASGYDDAYSVVQGWMKSKGHRENILGSGHKEIGVGYALGDKKGSRYWVMNLSRREDVFPVIINREAYETTSTQVWLYLYGEGQARSMRLSNDGKRFSEWEPFRRERAWELEPGEGLRTVYVELSDGQGNYRFSQDSIYLRSATASRGTIEIKVHEATAKKPIPETKAKPGTKIKIVNVPNSRAHSSYSSRGMILRAKPAPVIPIVFPVLGKAAWNDTFGAPRDNGTREHYGQDLTAPHMTPLLAAFDGVISIGRSEGVGGHNTFSIAGDHGWIAVYMHVNNDTPGTNDGMGTADYAFAPGLKSGDRVIAGQLVGWVGNSGNAETVGHHLHFELWGPDGVVNATPSLQAAQRLTSPRPNLPNPKLKIEKGEIRIDGVVHRIPVPGKTVVLALIAETSANGKAKVATVFSQKWIDLSQAQCQSHDNEEPLDTLRRLSKGTVVTVIGQDRGKGKAMQARLVVIAPVVERQDLRDSSIVDGMQNP
jgi:uncharacterized protein YkwD/murein DD-endopeptidase MepM/ murein hydrolase activator NlpD